MSETSEEEFISEEEFMALLAQVVGKLSNIAKTQRYRFQQKWEEYLAPLDEKPHLIRAIPFEEQKFLEDNAYRLKTLNTVSDSFVDGFYAIKSLLNALYYHFFTSSTFKEQYIEEDQLKIKYLIAKEILGNLVQYNKMDHESIPLKYNLLARMYTILKFNPKSDEAILKNMNKIFKKTPLSLEDIRTTMEKIHEDGLISINQEDQSILYKLKHDLELSEEGKKQYNETLEQLITWPTNLWRSFYNIRELNVTPPPSMKHHEFLNKILSRSATQGFSSANYVIKNLIKYFRELTA
jgi:hypothetical protein